MKITWITFGKLATRNGMLWSPLASARYRVILPARELEAGGHHVKFITVDADVGLDSVENDLSADAVIFSKTFHTINEKIAQIARSKGAKVIVDICDNHFESAKYGDHYRNMTTLADAIVVNTSQMAEVVKHHTGKESAVIGDPYEGPRGEPRWSYNGEDRLKALWFGHPVNLDTLELAFAALVEIGQRWPTELHTVTAPVDGMELFFQNFNHEYGRYLTLRYTPWSLEATWTALAQAQIVVIPSILSSANKTVKSPNRVVESLWAGRFVAANPLPSYTEFSPWAWIDPDIRKGIEWAMSHQDEIPPRIAEAQRYIDAHFSPRVIANRWSALLEA